MLYYDKSLLDKEEAQKRFIEVRNKMEELASNLSPEDTQIQSMKDASPTKWHLAHTTWFWETFLLKPFGDDYKPFDEEFHFLLNSYYNGEGPQFERSQRGLLSQPPLDSFLSYRMHVSDQVLRLLDKKDGGENWEEIIKTLCLGCNHEEQHQELVLTDIKHAFHLNPIRPAVFEERVKAQGRAQAQTWLAFDEGIYEIGHKGEGFAFDCEGPRHKIYLERYEIATRPVNNREFMKFIREGGYEAPEYWLSDGWDLVQQEGWEGPLYWHKIDDKRLQFTLAGMEPVNPHQPVCHLSFHEAYAYANWAGARLPREGEWEVAASHSTQKTTNDLSSGKYHPDIPDNKSDNQFLGDVWEWTSTAFSPYPGFTSPEGSVGEYNGKFMCNQYVLRGGSCATPKNHARLTYRNFFPPHSRWQFSGLRLARDIAKDDKKVEYVPNIVAAEAPITEQVKPQEPAPAPEPVPEKKQQVEKQQEEPKPIVTPVQPPKGSGFRIRRTPATPPKEDEKVDPQDPKKEIIKEPELEVKDAKFNDDGPSPKEEKVLEKSEEEQEIKQRANQAAFIDLKPVTDSFSESVLEGLRAGPKTLNPKFFYDERGSNLFTQITNTPEYYPTRTEISLLKNHCSEIASLIPNGSELIEFGAGSGEKIAIVLKEIGRFETCVAIDISGDYLLKSVNKVAKEFPDLNVIGIHGDYTKLIKLPPLREETNGVRMGFFPGSTIGNMAPPEAQELLSDMGKTLGKGSLFLIGVDLKKEPDILNAAYNDQKGLTAQFNKNILRRINRELEADFNLDDFEHIAFYNSKDGRVEMHLASEFDQKVKVGDQEFEFDEGETIHTENSYKYTNYEFQEMGAQAGLKLIRKFTDEDGLFTINLMRVER